MKYLLVSFLSIFIACTTKQPSPSFKNYKCTFFNLHGSYAHLSVVAPSLEDATDIAKTVLDRLVKTKTIPECDVLCEKEEQK